MSTTRTWIDLNSDVGESFGNYVLGRPEEVMQGISPRQHRVWLSRRRSKLGPVALSRVPRSMV